MTKVLQATQSKMYHCLFVAILCLIYVPYVGANWHVYDAAKDYTKCLLNGTSERAAEYKRRTRVVSSARNKEWKLWPDLISARDMVEDEVMYGFEEGMEAIWKNQHPADCSKVKYLISGGFESGFGSELHVIGAGLALALSMNRVYVMLPDQMGSTMNDKMHSINKFQVDIDFCRNQSHLNLECYYEPWSNCTIKDALHGASVQALRNAGLHMDFNKFTELDRPERALIVQLSSSSHNVIPAALEQIVECSPFNTGKYKYWWRALSTAYLMRPNEPTRQLIMRHRQDTEMLFDKEKEMCISVHVRRGDKHLEMKIIEDEKLFFDTALQLWNKLKNSTKTTQEHGVMYVGGEDPGVITSSQAWGKEHNWKILFSNLFDRSTVSTGLNSSEQAHARESGTFQHNEWEYFNMILTLDGHLRCSGFICTQRSNYCRAIDELRATVGGKTKKSYADFSCPTSPAPCIDSPRSGVGWRL